MTTAACQHESVGLSAEDCLRIWRLMRMTREFEMRMVSLYKRGVMYGGCFTSTGNEATAVGSAYALGPDDILAAMHRDLGAYLARGEDPLAVALEYLGRAGSPTRGTDGNLHHGNLALGSLGMISHIGASLPVAVGAAFGRRRLGRNAVAMTYVGDGGTSTADFHEAINYAAVQNVPVIFVIENNQYAYGTPTSKQFACATPADRAKGYGIPGVRIDGTDVLEVYRVCAEAVARGRDGGGPTLIESVTMRLRGHSEHDDFESYVPAELLEAGRKNDPIPRFEAYLLGEGILDEAKRSRLEADLASELDAVFDKALAAPPPDATEAERGVYAE